MGHEACNKTETSTLTCIRYLQARAEFNGCVGIPFSTSEALANQGISAALDFNLVKCSLKALVGTAPNEF